MQSQFSIPATHSSLEGHFPGDPLVPGVVILDEVCAAIQQAKEDITICGFPMVKFISPLHAEKSVTIDVNEKSETLLTFSCVSEGVKLVTGQVRIKSCD